MQAGHTTFCKIRIFPKTQCLLSLRERVSALTKINTANGEGRIAILLSQFLSENNSRKKRWPPAFLSFVVQRRTYVAHCGVIWLQLVQLAQARSSLFFHVLLSRSHSNNLRRTRERAIKTASLNIGSGIGPIKPETIPAESGLTPQFINGLNNWQ